jgi:hypothetical protein
MTHLLSSMRPGAVASDGAPLLSVLYLRYNHRSVPAIVAMLNAFSRTHFGDLHVDQIATRAPVDGDDGVRSHTVRGSKEVAATVAEVVCESEGAGSAYVISPVSVKKYMSTSTIVQGIRQSVYALGGPGGRVVKVLHGDDASFNPTEAIL